MKISRYNLMHRLLTAMISIFLLGLASPASAQVVDCSQRVGGGLLFNFQGDWCNETAADSTGTNTGVTCRACLGEKIGVHPAAWAKGGNSSCNNFSKVMVLDFPAPVADVQWIVYGARKVTDNRGYSVTLNPLFFPNGKPSSAEIAFFPGGGITQLIISDPFFWDEKDSFGNIITSGNWEIRSGDNSWVPGNVYDQCSCSKPAMPRPSPQVVISPDWDNNGVNDWRMDAEVSDDDGLVLRNVTLENRYMAEKISIPYYNIETNDITPAQRGELKPNGTEGFLRSRIVDYHAWSDDEKLVVEATYVVTDMPAGSSNCLQIIQRYEFHKRRLGCEPLAALECSPWKPFVKYQLFGPGQIVSLNIPQRFHFMVNGFPENSVGLFRDCDSLLGCLWGKGYVFSEKFNPLDMEWDDRIITQGQDAGTWDNIHQTFERDIQEPADFPHFFTPGCPECMHFHWRWGERVGEEYGGGKPLLVPPTNQDVDIGIALFRASEDDPLDYRTLMNTEVIQPMKYVNDDYRWPVARPDEVVFWYSSTGHQATDTFFPMLGAFFSPSFVGDTAPITPSTPPGSPTTTATARHAKKGLRSLSTSEDHPESVKFDSIYVDGPTTFTVVDPNTVGPLPAGYVLYDDDAYDISTEALVSGSHVVTFNVPSVTDQNVFDNLRILQIEPESFDPTVGTLLDRTILSPGTPAPDFPNRRISARVAGLGVFVLATLVQPPPPPNTDQANLAVTVTDSPDSIVADNDLTYVVTITNNGPQTAHELRLRDRLAPETEFVSATTSQGTCTQSEGRLICNLDPLASSATATVTIVAHVGDLDVPIPAGGKTIFNRALVAAQERDIDLTDNSVIASTTVMPPANSAPAVSIVTPAGGEIFPGPANVSISVTASDSDGSVSSVELYENENLIGTASFTAPDQYQLNWTNAPFGNHLLVALATDNLGKKRASKPVKVIVNGPATISIASPVDGSRFNKPANVTVKANASITGGSITKVDFYGDGPLLGIGTLTGPNEYSLTWNSVSAGRHVVYCVATDNLGVTSTSKPVVLTVNDPPAVNILTPATGAFFATSPATIPITALANDFDGSIASVSFFANGTFIGSKQSANANQFPFTWNNVQPGTYSLTAKATDSNNATSTSAPVTVIVNAPPAISINAPANGAQFPAPANITLTATATDADGSVTGVTFSANGISLGSATPIGGNQYSLTWSNVPQGPYAISATATDNLGITKSVGGINISVTTPALFVVGSTTLTTSDAFVKARLEGLNHTVTVMDAATVTTADATGKALVVISSTVNPTSVGTKFRTVTVPVLTWESGILNNMGMTGSTNKDFGTKSGQTQISITNPTHPLAAGVTGTATVVNSAKTFNWGKPNANAITIATISGDAAKTAIFGYEPGVAMPGLTAPARRLAIFLGDDSAEVLNNNGIFLLNAAIKWALGGGSISGSMVTSPVGAVNLTAAGIIDWAHWGRNGPSTFDHKAGVTPQKITNITKIGSGGLSWFADCPTNFSWTDGTPTLNVSNTPTGINTNGVVGNGFEITVPADTTTKTLKLYVGVWFTQGKLEATLSDASAPAYLDTTLNNNAGSSFGLYTINYKAAATGQTLKIRFTIQTQYFSPNGNVAWEAATLQ
jgi:uncharacterized repeat protein (TIGR01451 family)